MKYPFIMADTPVLTHVDAQGGVQMVDVSEKSTTTRTAVAVGVVTIGQEAFRLVEENRIRKGDVLTVAQIAGIQGAKQTSNLIPLCHDVALKGVDIEMTLNEERFAIEIRAFAKSIGPTGVEMEALTAVSVAALTIYDMCKSVNKSIVISGIHLVAKTGGQSGDYLRTE
jgi:cyclic pyranopterin phosphate synthase